MLYLIEILILLVLGYMVWRIFRLGFARDLLNLGIYCTGGVLAMLGFHLTNALLPFCTSNLVVRTFGGLLVMLTAYSVIVWYLRRRNRSDDAPTVVSIKKRLQLPRWGERLACGLMSLVLVAVCALMVLFLVTISSANPSWGHAIATRSLYLRYLAPWRAPDVLPPVASGRRPDQLDEVVAAQSGLLNHMRQRWTSARDSIANSTGTTAVFEQLEALREIVNLQREEQAWLAERNPVLKRLLNHPRLMDILRDDRLLDLIERVGNGSATALYALGDEPAVRAFIEDQEVQHVVKSIDLLELRRQVQQRRQSRETRFPLCWSVATIRTTLELDAQLSRVPGWENLGPTNVLSWPEDEPIGLARSRVRSADGAARSVELRFRTSGQVTLLVDDRSVKLTDHDGAASAAVTFSASPKTLVLMVNFVGSDSARTCFAEAVSR